jgi:chitinase
MIEESIIRINDKKENRLFEWFINQNHIPIDLDYHQLKDLYKDFIKEVISLFRLTNSQYYWFGQNGRLISDEGAPVIDSNNFMIDRDIMKFILRNNILEDLLSN